ncbi:hypothetical protein ACJW30_03G027200 [Castanea mollissima]
MHSDCLQIFCNNSKPAPPPKPNGYRVPLLIAGNQQRKINNQTKSVPATPLEIRYQIFIPSAYKIHKIQPHRKRDVTCIPPLLLLNVLRKPLETKKYWSLHNALAKKCSAGPSRYWSLHNSLATKT